MIEPFGFRWIAIVASSHPDGPLPYAEGTYSSAGASIDQLHNTTTRELPTTSPSSKIAASGFRVRSRRAEGIGLGHRSGIGIA